MKENLHTGFDQLKSSVTASLEVERPKKYIGLGSVEVFKPFVVGEKFAKLHPHQTEKGSKHKGNMIVIATNIVGSQAIAKCVLPNCNEMILLEVKNFVKK
jgi:hypothetical protein